MYDVIIAGGGAAGLTAGLYSARYGLRTLIIEKMPYSGGQLVLTDKIANFPSYDEITGSELSEKMKSQTELAGAHIISGEITGISGGSVKNVRTSDESFDAHAIIYAMGARRKKLGIKGEEEFAGRGVSYCAVCDGAFFKGKTVCVVGGGNTALGDALYLSSICEKVYLIHRRDEFRGSRTIAEKCEKTENIEILTSTVPLEIRGDKNVTSVLLKKGDEVFEISCRAVFAAVGSEPVSEPVRELCRLDENGYIIAGEDCITSAEGIFAAGDVRTKQMRQIITACSDGANAARSAEDFLRRIIS